MVLAQIPVNYHMYFNNCTHEGNMLIANGAVTSNVTVYQTNVLIEPNTDYIFSCEATNVAQAASVLARLQFSINGTQIGGIFSPTSTPCQWNRFYQIWHNYNATSAVIKILNQNTNADGNDFALDNIVFRKICKAYSSITIHVVDSLPPVYDTIYMPTCQNSYPVSFRDSTYTTQGTYHYDIPTSTISIADSFFTIIVSTLPIYDDTIRATLCQGQTYNSNGFNEDSTGVYVHNYQTEAGCDSITTLILTINPIYNDTIVETICGNEQYNSNGFNESESGFYTHSFTTAYGCDSIVNLDLTVIPIIDTTIYDTIIYGTIFNKYNYTAIDSGVYVFYYKFNPNDDCPKRVTLYLNVIIPEQVQVWFPNAFTPGSSTNNTFGYVVDDKFILQEFQIYNRWGAEVFSSNKQGEFWNGTFKGKPCDTGEYIYHLLYRTKLNGDCVYQKQGTFFLLK
jgi:gliding motility-associated-like protein